jgi:hypothetical protein
MMSDWIRRLAAVFSIRQSVNPSIRQSYGLNLLYFRNHLAKAGFDALSQGDIGGRTSLAGPPHTEQERAVPLIEVNNLDIAPVGGDIGPQRIQGLLDAMEDVHEGQTNLCARQVNAGLAQVLAGRRKNEFLRLGHGSLYGNAGRFDVPSATEGPDKGGDIHISHRAE